MMATALGRRSNAVRDVRRTFRAGLWLIAIVLPPYWLLLWHTGEIMRAFGQSDELARARASVPARLHVAGRPVASVPAAAQLRLRARAAADRAVAQPRRNRAQCADQLVADLRPSWAARARPGRRRARQHDHLVILCGALVAVIFARPPVPPFPSVRPLVAVRPAAVRRRWSSSAGRSARPWRWKWACSRSPLISWAGSALPRSPRTPSRCNARP